jgi:hypothetical protein
LVFGPITAPGKSLPVFEGNPAVGQTAYLCVNRIEKGFVTARVVVVTPDDITLKCDQDLSTSPGFSGLPWCMMQNTIPRVIGVHNAAQCVAKGECISYALRIDAETMEAVAKN